MPPIFLHYKSLVDKYLLDFLESKKLNLGEVNTYGPDLIEKIKIVAVAGKTIRGSLVLLSYCFSNKAPSVESLKAAAAMELFQTALIIHDDIMDHDEIRRGMPAMHKQYGSVPMAICTGDVLFFMAFELLGSIKTDNKTFGRIIRLASREYQSVAVAQMADISGTAKTKEDLLSLYTNKTARYTFALPLMLGATLAGTTKDVLKYLESFGVSAGILFQIRDDILDHKPMLGSHEIQAYKKAAEESIKRLPVPETKKDILRDLLNFVIVRKI